MAGIIQMTYWIKYGYVTLDFLSFGLECLLNFLIHIEILSLNTHLLGAHPLGKLPRLRLKIEEQPNKTPIVPSSGSELF